MANINDEDFFDNLDISNINIGIIGHGYVGMAIEHFFKDKCNMLIYDKNKSCPQFTSLSNLVSKSHIIYTCVPTPMKKSGECFTGIVESVLTDISNAAYELKRPLNEFIVMMKSTVYPGFTDEMSKKYNGMRIIFSPEFLTEANSIEDCKNANRIILGGTIKDATVVYNVINSTIPERIMSEKVSIVRCEPKVAELVKLYTNGFLATKVTFANEMCLLCNKLNVNYNEVAMLTVLDDRITSSHINVPGHDLQLGWGGSCFPKDINNLSYTSNRLETGQKLFSTVIERNSEMRGNKNWESMKGRAVVDDYDE